MPLLVFISVISDSGAYVFFTTREPPREPGFALLAQVELFLCGDHTAASPFCGQAVEPVGPGRSTRPGGGT